MNAQPVNGSWVTVDAPSARQYRYYGIGGWLAFFLVLMVLGVVFSAIFWLAVASELGTGFGQLDGIWQFRIGGLWLLGGIQVIWAIVALVQAFTLSPSFPKSMIWYFGFSGLTGMFNAWVQRELAIAGWGDMTAGQAFATAAGGLIVCALLMWYFAASKRVNATYLSRLNRSDPEANTIIAASFEPHRLGPQLAVPTVPVQLAAQAPYRASAPTAVAMPATSSQSAEQRLMQLKNLRDQGLIDEASYKAKQEDILRDL